MKMRMIAMTLEELQKIYSKPSVRKEGNGYYVRKIGWSGRKRNPNLQIHVPEMGIPIEAGEPINLLRGFNIPSLGPVMNLNMDYSTTYLFCKDVYVNKRGERDLCHVAICDPDDAQYILIVTAFEDSTSSSTDGMFEYSGVWNSHTVRWVRKEPSGYFYEERCGYSLVPVGFRDMSEDEKQTPEDMEATRREVISLANQYLGIETEELLKSEESDCPEEELLGITPTDQSVRLWGYEDDLSAENHWVIDGLGRLLAPDKTEDCKDKFIGVSIAEYMTWEKIPEGALVLSWTKPSVAGGHEFSVDTKPEILTQAQLERVAQLEDQIEKKYEGRYSPYTVRVSPSIDGGWNLWKH